MSTGDGLRTAPAMEAGSEEEGGPPGGEPLAPSGLNLTLPALGDRGRTRALWFEHYDLLPARAFSAGRSCGFTNKYIF